MVYFLLSTVLPRFNNPTPPLHLLNVRLSLLREYNERILADHHNRFKIFDVSDHLHLFWQGVKVRRMSLGSFFVLNCYYCINGTRCQFLGHIPLTLDDYIPYNEVLRPPPIVQLGDMWDYGTGVDPEEV